MDINFIKEIMILALMLGFAGYILYFAITEKDPAQKRS